MGLDGFSMGNLGLTTELTSAQISNQAEQIAKKESKIEVKVINESEKDSGVKRKKEDEEEKRQKAFNDGFKKNEEEEEEDFQDNKSKLAEQELENKDPKEFSVRINSRTEKVELINTKEKKVIETINAQDLMDIVSKLDNASGVLVNRKI